MERHPNILPCFGVIQNDLGLNEMGQNVIIIQVFDPALIPAHHNCTKKPLRSSSKTNHSAFLTKNKNMTHSYIIYSGFNFCHLN